MMASSRRVMTLADVPMIVGETTPILAPCQCRSHHPPIHTVDGTCLEIRHLIEVYGAPAMTPATPFLTYRCPKCKGVALGTLQDVHLI